MRGRILIRETVDLPKSFDPVVDKTGLIGLINHTVGTKRKLTCVSRPRRFGKSCAALMLCAYYDRTCDSSGLFERLEIAKDPRLKTI